MILLRAILLLFVAAVATAAQPAAAAEPIVGLPCEGCEAVFVGRPASLSWEARLAPPGLTGEPLLLEGTVRDRRDRPVAGVIVYAYQTNADGVYPPDDRTRGTAAANHGGLRGWARTDARGRYRFTTVRPGGDPASDDPQHIHMHLLEPGRCTYSIDSVHFDDDPRLTQLLRLRMLTSRGGRGIVKPERDASGRWRARRDIKLGQGIRGYDQCGGRR
ncbi:MAG: hypothetical protein ABIP29_03345 [Candidatus Eisenbacteria bacterium]